MSQLKYIADERQRLEKIKAGIKANPNDFANTGITEATIQAEIDKLDAADTKILVSEQATHLAREEAKALVKHPNSPADIIELKIKGVYAGNHAKWPEFGIPDDTAANAPSKMAPAKGFIKHIKDDHDGVGFDIEGMPLDNIEHYEWQRGIGKVEDVTALPQFTHLRITTRAKLVDDDVQKGLRYFYRYRGVNKIGNGEWSEPTNKIQ